MKAYLGEGRKPQRENIGGVEGMLWRSCYFTGSIAWEARKEEAGDKLCVDYSCLYPSLGSVIWGDSIGVGVQIMASA